MGSIYKVKILGILGLIDQNETDWKVIGINICDNDCSKIDSLNDIIKLNQNIRINTFLVRKLQNPLGKNKNKFAFDGKYKNSIFAKKIINSCHKMWKNKLKIINNYLINY